MGNYVQIAKIGELSEGNMKEITLRGREFLLAMVGGKYYVANGLCPHMGGHLAQGKLDGLIVTCPRHGSRFDLGDGHVVEVATRLGLAVRYRQSPEAAQAACCVQG
jgi:nitrite reductase/ring-hydroxylating ferredoxin subunit